jgi:hypothetical protein
MLLIGRCHCGNIAFELDWPGNPPEIPARACDCSFCVKHGGVWTSNPSARLAVAIRDASLVSKYVFGTRTATFHVCSRCGAVPLVTSEIANHVHAVVNVNAIENVDPAWLRLISTPKTSNRASRAEAATGSPMSALRKAATDPPLRESAPFPSRAGRS